MNIFGNQLPTSTLTTLLFVALAIFAVIFDRMWRKLSFGHPAFFLPNDHLTPG